MSNFHKCLRIFRENWITFWMIAAIIAVGGFITQARYNDGRNVVKRVVATQKEARQLFTSDLLSSTTASQIRNVNISETNNQFFDFSLYDYDLDKPGVFYPSDIEYDIRISFWNNAGTLQITSAEDIDAFIGTDTIRLYKLTNGTPSNSSILEVDKDDYSDEDKMYSGTIRVTEKTDSFRLYLPISMKNKDIAVKVTATPKPGYPDLPSSLSGLFMIKTQSFTQIDGWTGDFMDDTTYPPKDYDGFNYSLTGSGTATGTLSWDHTLLEPNMQQIDEIKTTGATIVENGNYSQISVSLDSSANSGRYDIQFYVKDSNARTTIDSKQWMDMKKTGTGYVVKFTTS